jgi:hypothetical protein
MSLKIHRSFLCFRRRIESDSKKHTAVVPKTYHDFEKLFDFKAYFSLKFFTNIVAPSDSIVGPTLLKRGVSLVSPYMPNHQHQRIGQMNGPFLRHSSDAH